VKKYQIVIDTNVLISALRSKNGASYRLLELIGISEKFETNISIPVFFEYESISKRIFSNFESLEIILGYISLNSNKCEIHYLWRPFLNDNKDDCILEAALNSHSDYIITYNKDDFKNINQFGIETLTPKEFLQIIGEIK
jgi:putative PIN family toxin of toxin-antitoxin system